MHENVEYKKLLELKESLEWFGDTLPYVSKINKLIDNRIEEIPEVARIFDTLAHGQTSKKWILIKKMIIYLKVFLP